MEANKFLSYYKVTCVSSIQHSVVRYQVFAFATDQWLNSAVFVFSVRKVFLQVSQAGVNPA